MHLFQSTLICICERYNSRVDFIKAETRFELSWIYKVFIYFKCRLQRRDSLHMEVEEEHESFVYHPLQILYRQLIKHNF